MKMKCTFWVIIVLAFASCVEDKPKDPTPADPQMEGRKVFIANEGSLGNGNASLSFYNTASDSVYNNVFLQKNSQELGDVFQSIFIDSDRIYLAINNSDKVVVLDRKNLSLIATIPLTKPRYFLKVSESKIYVSSLYNAKVFIINPQTLSVTGEIAVDFPNTEGMLKYGDKAYVCNWDTACGYIYEVNTQTDQITNRINIAGRASQQVVLDKNNKLWVLAGNVYKQKQATLTQIDPQTNLTLKSFTFPSGADVMKPCFNATKDTLYFLGVNYSGGTDYNGLYRMSIEASQLPNALFVAAAPYQYYWGLGIDSATNHIYLADPKGFIQRGNVAIYQPNGEKIKSFDVELGPGFFAFE